MPLLTSPAIGVGSIACIGQPGLDAGEGVQLRPWREEDDTAVAEVYRDPQIRRWHSRTIDDLAEARSLIGSWRRGWEDETGAAWAVVDDADHVVGRIALTALDLHEGTGDVAYWTRVEARGCGVAPRAVRCVADWASHVGFHRLQLKHSTRNPTSCRVAVKAGFRPEGTLASAVLHEDGWHDMHVHALILTGLPPRPRRATTTNLPQFGNKACSSDIPHLAHAMPLSDGLSFQVDREHHSHLVEGRRHHFWTDRLWALSRGLPVIEVRIDHITEFDQDCWFHGRAPTGREVADHARRIEAADLRYPVILAADGSLMDGGHRVSNAWLEGQSSVAAVRFAVDPTPDWLTDEYESVRRAQADR